MPTKHWKFGPSKSKMLLDCPAALGENEKYPDVPKIYAAWGSVAHTLAERVGKQGGVASMYIGETFLQDGFTITVDEEMAECVTRYLAWCAVIPGDHFIETQVDISTWTPIPDQHGTSDFIAARPGHLTVVDLKGGEGVQVYAEENPQAILYALGSWKEWNWLYDFKTVSIQIVQPRLDHIDVWDTTIDHLLKRGEEFKQRFKLAVEPNPPYGPSVEACRFCKANGRCKAQADYLGDLAALAFDDIDGQFVNDMNALTLEEIVHAWRVRKLYENRLNEIERILVTRMMKDEPVPGLKAVEGKVRRRWKNEAEARQFLIDQMKLAEDFVAPRKMISPAKVEKAIARGAHASLQPYWIKPPGKPSLVDERDPRPAYQVKSLAAFDVLEPVDADDAE